MDRTDYTLDVRIQLPNGQTVNVTDPDMQNAIANLLKGHIEDGEHYFSSTRGIVNIKSMETHHLKNAILKRLAKQLEGLRSASILETQQYFDNADATTYGMIQEFLTR